MVNDLKKNNNGKGWKSLFASLQKAYERFLKIRGNPHEIALGFALGLFVGVAPCMGIQTVIAVFLASLLKWNKISAAVGVWISNPISAPFLYGFTFYVGSLFTGVAESFRPAGVFDFSYLYQIVLKAREIFWTLTIGGVIVGFPVAVLGYYLSYMAVNRYQNKIKQKIAERKERLSVRKERIKTRKKQKNKKNKNR
ncbi:MAG: DUF2062 domain-containing protein [Desulfobacterales bacterium]